MSLIAVSARIAAWHKRESAKCTGQTMLFYASCKSTGHNINECPLRQAHQQNKGLVQQVRTTQTAITKTRQDRDNALAACNDLKDAQDCNVERVVQQQKEIERQQHQLLETQKLVDEQKQEVSRQKRDYERVCLSCLLVLNVLISSA